MFKLLISCILISLIIKPSFSQDKYIQILLSNDAIPIILLGESRINFAVDIRTNITTYNKDKTSLSNLKQLYPNNDLFYEDSSSQLYLANNTISNIPFTLNIKLGDRYILALGYEYLNKDYSIVHQLHMKGYILHNKFAIYMNYNKKEPRYLYFGGFPRKYTLNRNEIKIPIIPSNVEWAFDIKMISINDNINITLNKKGYLGIKTSSMIVDKSIYDFLKTHIFKDAFENKICYEKVWQQKDGANIKCNKGVPKFAEFYMHVNDNKVKLPFTIKERDDHTQELDIAYNKILDKTDYIWLDKYFLFQYDVEFNYDDKVVSLYSKTENDVLYTEEINPRTENNINYAVRNIYLFTSLILLLYCSIFLILIIKQK